MPLGSPVRENREVFLAVHRGIQGFDPNTRNATFRGWLWKITRNAILQWLRRNEPLPPGGSTARARLEEIPDSWSGSSSDEPPGSVDDMASLIRRALLQIRPSVEPQTWEAFWNTTVLGGSAPQVAQELGLTPAAVR